MKAKKIVRYRIPVSQVFPATHPRKGEQTNFNAKILNTLGWFQDGVMEAKKLHTIRANYALWAKRFEKIDRGEAVLELYYWNGKPYNSKTETICQLGKEDGIGIQGLYFEFGRLLEPFISSEDSENGTQTYISTHELAKNDGLIYPDFKTWFKGYDLSEPMAIIHFTNFRY